MQFKATFCDPFQRDVVHLGNMDSDALLEKFRRIRWSDYLQKMQGASEKDMFYSPSFGAEDNDSNHALEITSIEENEGKLCFYVFYKRPKEVKSFFGGKKMRKEYLTEIHNQTLDQSFGYLNALCNKKYEWLEKTIK